MLLCARRRLRGHPIEMRATLIAGIVVSRRAASRLVMKDILTIAGLLSLGGVMASAILWLLVREGQRSRSGNYATLHSARQRAGLFDRGGSTSSCRTLLNA